MVDQDYLRVRKYFLLIFFLFSSSVSYSDDYSLAKITKLDDPWGSTFINNDELIVTEKDGKIKIVNINSQNIFEVKHNLNFLNVGQGGLLILFTKIIVFGFLILKIEITEKQALQLLKQY